MAARQDILDWCDDTLQVTNFSDYAPNGLQVEGCSKVERIVTSVTASFAAIEYAATQQADMLLVHHGMFWRSEPVTITGWKKQRIATLLQHQINMVGYHLPLDAHPKLGNNAQLAKRMGWIVEKQTGEQNLLNIGCLSETQSLTVVAAMLAHELEREPIVVGNNSKEIRKLAWCTGGAQNFFQQAIDEGVDAYITGEISEAQYHLANETGVAFISAGHHATERYGVQALGEAIKSRFGVELYCFDEQNPA
ncbi:Nif3-like dinuclear metal center hexameric protein [Neisseria wadsworthii]|uniref:GTP cyclohydrolase 1 type 2 homolog n=1 Tax=Neisseria wadsworthii 9715 TaxID=1030841 RepID=G4CLP5_9NEIS|nr:Nif3-like dinuclear metal center hexameric protein [Neisseria wadsworthii]EGZ51356.1 NIF3 family protein [Neisseria wadsworthii 9715]QMT36094.1 Nif3-like dinuclear metal center hexameric protein [Neisseria wadsworthii]